MVDLHLSAHRLSFLHPARDRSGGRVRPCLASSAGVPLP